MGYRRATKRYGTHELPPAFTLVELLVVMAIISMLMSIMLPGLSRAREAGKRIHCSANIRGLTLAWTMYANENNDKLCSAFTLRETSGPQDHWVCDGLDYKEDNPFFNPDGGTAKAIKDGALWPYTEVLKLYKCKSDTSPFVRSYSISGTMHGSTIVQSGGPYTNLVQIPRSSEKLVFAEPGIKAKKQWLDGPFKPISSQITSPDTILLSFEEAGPISVRHDNGCNISFADNHCEYWKYKDRRTIEFSKGRMSTEDASPGNLDISRLMEMLRGIGYQK
jgi:prepilin-type N-terminal cleavage/methylation domain-containing protein/prepilin-type processing-associated H-X9-DG protein